MTVGTFRLPGLPEPTNPRPQRYLSPCQESGKIRWLTAADAWTALRAHGNMAAGIRDGAIYECPACLTWHFTRNERPWAAASKTTTAPEGWLAKLRRRLRRK